MHDFDCINFDKEYCAKFSNINWEKRWDDDLDIFEKRFEVYNNETLPVIEEVSHYKNFIELDLFDSSSYEQIIKAI